MELKETCICGASFKIKYKNIYSRGFPILIQRYDKFLKKHEKCRIKQKLIVYEDKHDFVKKIIEYLFHAGNVYDKLEKEIYKECYENILHKLNQFLKEIK